MVLCTRVLLHTSILCELQFCHIVHPHYFQITQKFSDRSQSWVLRIDNLIVKLFSNDYPRQGPLLIVHTLSEPLASNAGHKIPIFWKRLWHVCIMQKTNAIHDVVQNGSISYCLLIKSNSRRCSLELVWELIEVALTPWDQLCKFNPDRMFLQYKVRDAIMSMTILSTLAWILCTSLYQPIINYWHHLPHICSPCDEDLIH